MHTKNKVHVLMMVSFQWCLKHLEMLARLTQLLKEAQNQERGCLA